LAKEVLLVDGYNIIHAWPELKKMAMENHLDNARTRLLEILSDYQGYKKNEIIVVFDAYKAKNPLRSIDAYHNIHVIYTKEHETADHYIEKVATEYARDYQIRVATSDALEQTIILAKGAARMSARELQSDIKATKKEYKADYLENSTRTTNRLEGHLNKETLAWMEKFRRQR
jgi:predicted RNA-binding protein with PIN domain